MRRDRTLAMKWVETFAIANPDEASVRLELEKKNVSAATVTDQIRRLRHQGILPKVDGEVEKPKRQRKANAHAVDGGVPFRPVPKSAKKTTKKK